MALDGIVISNIIYELKKKIIGGRIDKIYQPEKDEIIISVRSLGKVYKILVTANPSHPRIHITEKNKKNPMQPPLFCMVLRKYLSAGKIIEILQPKFERIINIKIESMNEMGDYSIKNLILEIMGKHSNLILTDENGIILECAKHITHEKSSVREILPGKKYEFPPSKNKIDTITLNRENFEKAINENQSLKVQKFIYQSYNGISPLSAEEICFRAKIDDSKQCSDLTNVEKNLLYNNFLSIINDIKLGKYSPEIIYENNNKLLDFSSFNLSQFENFQKKKFNSISELLEDFYAEKDLIYRINQKSQDLKKLIQNNIERCVKKKEMQINTLKKIKNRETLRLYGELITANIYSIQKGMTILTTKNFYDENYSDISIPLEADLTPSENAQKYFKQYNKEKRTYNALKIQIKQNNEELEYLEAVLNSVMTSTDEQNITEIREELYEQGFIKKQKKQKGKQRIEKTKPYHYISSDGFDIYVGKNNKQNDELTLKFAHSGDLWLHTKNIPGSHVIIVTNGKDIPDTTINQGAVLAAFYSKGKNSTLVPVDYTSKKYVKKPSGAKPGMVIYETNKTAYITPSEELIEKIKRID